MSKKYLREWDKKYLWHPFTQMQDWVENDQLIIERGDGVFLYDTGGNKYIDGVSSLWVTVHGHRKKEINNAIKRQLDKVAHSTLLGLGNVPSIELAKRLVDIAPPGLNKVFFSDNGSTAVEVALKIAFQYWQQVKTPNPKSEIRNNSKNLDPKLKTPDFSPNSTPQRKTRFLTLVNAYHGDTIGSVSVGGIDLFHRMYKPLLFKAFKAPSPYCYRCPDKCSFREPATESRGSNTKEPRLSVSGSEPCLQKLEAIMRSHHHEIAAMIVEPMVQAAAGMLTMPPGYLKAVRQLCNKYDILLICDEVATGFGRTGQMFACELEGVSPDIMCVAKGLTGGYLPVAATLTTQKIYAAFLGRPEEKKTFFHGHTYTGNPLGCAAALASLDLFKKEKLLKNVITNSELITHSLRTFNELKHVGDIRQCGMMVGIELVKNKKTKEVFPYKARIGHRVILEARKRGVILRPLGEVIVLMPPLSITTKELLKLLKTAYDSISVVTN